jgi:hypothetical protein
MLDIETFEAFIEQFRRWGLERFRKYYGVYHGIVTRNDDPEARGRIQAHVPEAAQSAAPDKWIFPAMSGAGPDHGEFFPPEVGDGVWVCFERGDPGLPKVYWGGWYGKPSDKNDVPSEFQSSAEGTSPYKRGWKTKAGHLFQFVDKAGEEAVRIVWHNPDGDKYGTLSFEKDGSIVLTNQNGSLVQLDAPGKALKLIDENGNFVTMDESGVQIVTKKGDAITAKGSIQLITQGDIVLMGRSLNANVGGVSLGQGAAFPIPKGTELMSYFNQIVQWALSHIHPITSPASTGPSTVPLLPPTPAILSQSNKTK